jgi:signal transduction histidine kinase
VHEARLRALLDVGRSLVSELDPDAVLQRLLVCARELTGARYAAIGVLDDAREQLERFIVAGIDDETHRAIGDLPRGRGVLGVLIDDPRPLRLADVGAHPHSYGFPAHHPPMTTFLGVPVLIRGEAWGNLYLTEKEGGEPFTDEDEDAAVLLAEWAAVAITNARLYRHESSRRHELERANRALETTVEVARVLGGVTDVDVALELIVKRSRALLDARAAEVALVDGDQLVLAAVTGDGLEDVRGTRLALEDSLAGRVLASGRTQRLDEVPVHAFAHRRLGARRAIVVPMVFRTRTLGVLMVFDRMGEDAPFTADDQRLLEAFAVSAASAVATAQTATDAALRRSIKASEDERRRWARELHDETLQELAGLRVTLGGARRTGDAAALRAAIDGAIEMLTVGVSNLRSLIADLRPASLDELGVEAALESLIDRVRTTSGMRVELDVRLRSDNGRGPGRLDPEIEATVYRLVQEALTNVNKHAGAETVWVTVAAAGGALEVAVRDDGRGFDAGAPAAGFGLLGMRERLALVGGSLDVRGEEGRGTSVQARIPLRAEAAAAASPEPA